MSTLRAAAHDYLAMRRALGFKLTSQGRLLASFIDYCEQRNACHVTTELAVAWATHPPRGGTDPVHHSRRLMVVRIFARHLQALDPATEIPPQDVLTPPAGPSTTGASSRTCIPANRSSGCCRPRAGSTRRCGQRRGRPFSGCSR
jgi:hypothetical protein